MTKQLTKHERTDISRCQFFLWLLSENIFMALLKTSVPSLKHRRSNGFATFN